MTDHEFWKEIGRKIQVIRIQTGLKQKHVAAAAAISAPSLSLIENGRLPCSVLTLKRIAFACGKTVTISFVDEDHA